MSEKKVIASISGGKDSLAALVTHIEHGGRCDGAVYCRIMFDNETSAEYPEHEEWLHSKCFPTLEREYGVEPGTVAEVAKDRLVVQTGQGSLAIRSLQLEGKKRMDAGDFLRGYAVEAGTRLERRAEE